MSKREPPENSVTAFCPFCERPNWKELSDDFHEYGCRHFVARFWYPGWGNYDPDGYVANVDCALDAGAPGNLYPWQCLLRLLIRREGQLLPAGTPGEPPLEWVPMYTEATEYYGGYCNDNFDEDMTREERWPPLVTAAATASVTMLEAAYQLAGASVETALEPGGSMCDCSEPWSFVFSKTPRATRRKTLAILTRWSAEMKAARMFSPPRTPRRPSPGQLGQSPG